MVAMAAQHLPTLANSMELRFLLVAEQPFQQHKVNLEDLRYYALVEINGLPERLMRHWLTEHQTSHWNFGFIALLLPHHIIFSAHEKEPELAMV